MIERTFEVSDFHSVRLSGSHAVILSTGSEGSVRAEGDESALENLQVSCADGVLSIGSRRRGLFGFGRTTAATIHVTTPELRQAAIAGSGGIQVSKVAGESFEGKIAGSGKLSVDEMDVSDAQFRIAGSGSMKAAGTARHTATKIAGSGNVDLSALIAEETEISVAGSGDVKAHATESARIRIAGSGDVEVTGGARSTIKQAGSGKVRCS